MRKCKEGSAFDVLAKLEEYISKGKSIAIDDCYKELAIYDWWPETLSVSNMKDMRAFLKTAIKLGFDEQVWFNVGVRGCSNGMWAYKKGLYNETEYPHREFIYHSFTPEYNCWDVSIGCINDYGTSAAELLKHIKRFEGVEDFKFRDVKLKDIKEAMKDPEALLNRYQEIQKIKFQNLLLKK